MGHIGYTDCFVASILYPSQYPCPSQRDFAAFPIEMWHSVSLLLKSKLALGPTLANGRDPVKSLNSKRPQAFLLP